MPAKLELGRHDMMVVASERKVRSPHIESHKRHIHLMSQDRGHPIKNRDAEQMEKEKKKKEGRK